MQQHHHYLTIEQREFVRLEADPLAMHCRTCSRLPVTPGV